MHSVDPVTERMIRTVLAHAENRIRMDPVPLDCAPRTPEQFEAVFGGLLGEEGTDPDQVLGLFTSTIAPTVASADSPRFLGFIPAAPTKAALLFDMLLSAASVQGISWLEASGAVHAENQALRLIADAAGLPPEAGGVFVSGGSAGNLSALAVAREVARRRDGDPAGRYRVVVGEDVHSSVTGTLRLLDLDPYLVRCPDHRLTGDLVRRALDRDGIDPVTVAAVVATAGTTNAGIVDDLAGLGDVAHRHGWWFHVDGAYGGAGLLAPEVRDRFVGVEQADSFVVDPHKWLFAPFDCCALLYRDPATARSVHAQQASYLDVIHEDPEAWNPGDYAYHLTRRARGLPLWFSLAVHGRRAYAEAIGAAVRIARAAAAEVRARPWLELVREPDLSVVLFRRPGWESADYQEWAEALRREQVAFVPPSAWEGRPVGRLAFLHPHTPIELVREVLDRTAG